MHQYPGNGPHANLTTMIATPHTVIDQAWYPDSGAFTHMNNDANKLSHAQPYDGSGRVVIGDGRSLVISHVGTSVLSSLAIKDVLHVPHIQKNLLSISKFTKDNNVYFEFHSKCCYVKDLHTHQILLQVTECGGLYQLKPVPFSLGMLAAHVVDGETSVTQFGLWQRRLGHPSTEVLAQCLKSCQLSVPRDSIRFLCHACELGKAHELLFASSFTMYNEPLELIVGFCTLLLKWKAYYISFDDSCTGHV